MEPLFCRLYSRFLGLLQASSLTLLRGPESNRLQELMGLLGKPFPALPRDHRRAYGIILAPAETTRALYKLLEKIAKMISKDYLP